MQRPTFISGTKLAALFPPLLSLMTGPIACAQSAPPATMALAQRFEAVAGITKRIADATPAEHDDPNTVLAATGQDPQKILAWVRANTHIVPYAGMLRGPAGVLADRAGNSLDRALFLADLLRRAGLNARIARQQLTEQSADALLARFDAAWPTPLPTSLDKKALISIIGSVPGFDAQVIEKSIDASLAAQSSAMSEVAALHSKVMPSLLELLGEDGRRDSQLAKSSAALLSDHFWVQLQQGDNWENLDPDADVIGPQLPTQTFLPRELPSGLLQRMTVTLTIETLAAGKLTDTAVLTSSWLPSELAGKPLTIFHTSYPQPIPAAADKAAFQKTLLTNLTGVAAVVPGIVVGDHVVTGKLYSFEGKVADATPMDLASMGGAAIVNSSSLASGIASVFGDSAPAPAQPPAATSTVVAEWLDIETSAPGQQPRKERRAIFDLIGANKRVTGTTLLQFSVDDQRRLHRALALLGTIDLWVGANAPAVSSITRLNNSQLSSFAANTASALRTGNDPATTAGSDPVNPVFWTWNMLRRQSNVPLIFDRPNIALFWRRLSLRADRSIASQLAFDIVENGVATDTNFSHRVAQGIFDTAAEYAAIGHGHPTVNTAAAYAADLGARRDWSLIVSGSESRAAVTPAALARIKGALSIGDLVVAPTGNAAAQAPGSNWWRVGSTGTALGIGVAGMGVTAVEESKTLQISAYAARIIRALGCAASIGFSYSMDLVERKAGDTSWSWPSIRTTAEGLVCVAGIAVNGGKFTLTKGVANGGTEVSAFLFNLGYTLLTSPLPEEPGGQPQPGGSDNQPNASHEPNASYEPAPVCTDDGC